MMVISEVQVEVAQLRVCNRCVVDGDLDHFQQYRPIMGMPHVRLLLHRQDNCPQYLFRGLVGFPRCTVGFGVER